MTKRLNDKCQDIVDDFLCHDIVDNVFNHWEVIRSVTMNVL